MTVKEVEKKFDNWYGHLAKWSFVPMATLIIFMANQQYRGLVKDIEDIKANTDAVLKKDSEHTLEHQRLHSQLDILTGRVSNCEYQEISMKQKMDIVYYLLDIKPEPLNNEAL